MQSLCWRGGHQPAAEVRDRELHPFPENPGARYRTGGERPATFTQPWSLMVLWQKSAPSGCLLKDHRREEADDFRRTQVIPVIHTLVLQEALVAKQLRVTNNLLSAFRKARSLAGKYMNEEERDEARWLSDAIGYDPYGYASTFQRGSPWRR